MSRIFLIPGLGADCRIYKKLDLGGWDFVNIDWLKPNATDSLTDYAYTLINHHNISTNDIVVGNSLGGMIAIEIGKIIHLKKVILISSIRTIDEAPGYFNFFRNIRVYKLIPENAISSLDYFLDLFFGKLKKKDEGLFMNMLKTWSPKLLQWAIDAILKWDNKVVPENTYLVVGDNDLVFPSKNVKNAIIVKGGTHVMIYDKADEINKILKEILSK